jgi:hypothetical protein
VSATPLDSPSQGTVPEAIPPRFRPDETAAACLLLLLAAHVLAALRAAASSIAPRSLEAAAIEGLLQLALGAGLAWLVGWLTFRFSRGANASACRLACAVWIGTQVYWLRDAFTPTDSSAAARVVAQALAPPSTRPSEPPAASAPRPATVADVLRVLEQAAAVASPDERELIEATREAVARLEPAALRHARAFEALRAAGGIELGTIQAAEDLEQRLDLLADLAAAGQQLESELGGLTAAIEQRLETRFEHGTLQGFLRDFERSAGLDVRLALCEAEAGFCRESRRLLNMLWRSWGRWRPPAEGARRPAFDDPTLEEDYDRVMTRILRFVAQQAELRQALRQPP